MIKQNSVYLNIINDKYLEKEAIYFYGTKIKYKKLYQMIDSFSSYLNKLNIKKGDVVSIILPNSIEAIIAIYAANKIGAIVSILHPLLPEKAIQNILKETSSKCIILLSNKRKEIENIIKNQIIIETRISNYLPLHKKIFLLKKEEKIKYFSFYEGIKCKNQNIYEYTDDAFYLGSGGTTGKSKIIVLSNNSLNNLSLMGIELIKKEHEYNHTMLLALPIFHGFGLALGLHTMLSYGMRVNIISKIDIDQILKSIKKSKTSIITGVPQIYEKMLMSKYFEKSIKSVEYSFVGGDSINKNTLDKLNSIFAKKSKCKKIYEGYGLTETVTVCFCNKSGEYKFGTQGKKLRNVHYFLDKNNELYISSDTMMTRYLNDEEETKKVMIEKNGKKYIKTGDICEIDNNNFLIFKERNKRVFRIASINVYPKEIEKLVNNIDFVDLSVLTLQEKEGKNYTRLYVTLKNNIIIDDKIYKNIVDIINKNMLKYAIPKEIVQIDKIPLTNIGKIDYNSIGLQKVIKMVGE